MKRRGPVPVCLIAGAAVLLMTCAFSMAQGGGPRGLEEVSGVPAPATTIVSGTAIHPDADLDHATGVAETPEPRAAAEVAPVETLSAEDVVARVNAVPEGDSVIREMTMNLTNRNGQTRSRTTRNYRTYDEGIKKTAMFFLEPANVRGTAFLIWDYPDVEKSDIQWLYLPALRRARRVAVANRGDYFLGTDFTYEDMKLGGRFETGDYDFRLLGVTDLGGVRTYKLEGTPKSAEVARELGYSKTISWVELDTWMLLQSEFYDLKENHLKTLRIGDIRPIDGLLTQHRLTMENHQTGHTTEFVFDSVDYRTRVPEDIFTSNALSRGG